MFASPKLTNFLDLQGYESVVNVDLATNFHHFGNVLVVEPEDLLTAVLLITIVQGYLDHVALLQLHLSCAALSKSLTDIIFTFWLVCFPAKCL